MIANLGACQRRLQNNVVVVVAFRACRLPLLSLLVLPLAGTACQGFNFTESTYKLLPPPTPQPTLQAEGADASSLRFKVDVPLSPEAEAARAAAAEAAAKRKAEEEVRLERLRRKYGLASEAARRLVPADRDAAASGVLLRDICSALLRVAAGRPAAKGEQPKAGKLQSEENEVRGWLGRESGGPWGWLVSQAVPLQRPECLCS